MKVFGGKYIQEQGRGKLWQAEGKTVQGNEGKGTHIAGNSGWWAYLGCVQECRERRERQESAYHHGGAGAESQLSLSHGMAM